MDGDKPQVAIATGAGGEEARARVEAALRDMGADEAAESFLEATAHVAGDRDAVLGSALKWVGVTISGVPFSPPSARELGKPFDWSTCEADGAGNLVALAWRALNAEDTGRQDLSQGKARPLVHANEWRVAVDDDQVDVALPDFLRQGAENGWEVAAVVPSSTIEQNSASETWLGALNFRDTRVERVMTQMIYMRKIQRRSAGPELVAG